MSMTNGYKVMTLQLSEITVDPELQSRATLNQSVVREYAEDFRIEGVIVPAVSVFHDGESYWLADGFHRLAAFKSLGRDTIEAHVYTGNRRDALLQSCSANVNHGLRRTLEDKRRAVTVLLNDPEWKNWSDNEISTKCSVGRRLVSTIRKSLGHCTSERTYRTKHGSLSIMKTAEIGHSAGPPLTQDFQMSDGAPPPMTEIEALTQKLLETENLCSETLNENEKLRDAIAIGQYDASDIEKIDVEEALADLREQIRIKDIEIASLRESRDTYQNRCAEQMKQIKVLQAKLKKAGIE